MKPLNSSRPFAGDAAEVLYRLMLAIDNYEDLDAHPVRESAEYHAAVRGLGWHIDWEAVADARN